MVFLAAQILGLGGVRRKEKNGFNRRSQFRTDLSTHFRVPDHACWSHRRFLALLARRGSLGITGH